MLTTVVFHSLNFLSFSTCITYYLGYYTVCQLNQTLFSFLTIEISIICMECTCQTRQTP